VSDAARSRSLIVLGLFTGLVFGFGLVLGGMTRPENVLAFLDVGGLANGTWDGRLALVMGGAIAVFLPVWLYVSKRGRPLLEDVLAVPTDGPIDARLVGGAAIFGLGWGLAGYCPGPALVSLGAGFFDGEILATSVIFVVAMIGGQRLAVLFETRAAVRVAEESAKSGQNACSPDAPSTAE
jgi:uncharacterized protein